MSSGLDLDKVLDALSNEGSGIQNNSASLMGLAKEVNTVLAEVEKTVVRLDNMKVLPGIMRLAGKKFEVDVETPLVGSSQGITPASDYHRTVYEKLQTMTAEQIGEVLLHGSKKPDTTTE